MGIHGRCFAVKQNEIFKILMHNEAFLEFIFCLFENYNTSTSSIRSINDNKILFFLLSILTKLSIFDSIMPYADSTYIGYLSQRHFYH